MKISGYQTKALFQIYMKTTMDAKQIFDCILSQIETSCLNYAVSKTPYSATISLKCSFAKRFHHSETDLEKQQNCVVGNPSSVRMEDENVSDLNATVFENSASEQTNQFREELLQVKR